MSLAFLNIGFWEFAVIVLAVMVVFGPKRIPEVARAIGRATREFRKALRELEERIQAETDLTVKDLEDPLKDLRTPGIPRDAADSDARREGTLPTDDSRKPPSC